MSPKAWLVSLTLPSDLTNLSPHTPSSFLWAPWKTAGVHIPTCFHLNTQNLFFFFHKQLSILLLLISVLGIKGYGNILQAAIAGVVFNMRNLLPPFQWTNFTLSRSISGLSFIEFPVLAAKQDLADLCENNFILFTNYECRYISSPRRSCTGLTRFHHHLLRCIRQETPSTTRSVKTCPSLPKVSWLSKRPKHIHISLQVDSNELPNSVRSWRDLRASEHALPCCRA